MTAATTDASHATTVDKDANVGCSTAAIEAAIKVAIVATTIPSLMAR